MISRRLVLAGAGALGLFPSALFAREPDAESRLTIATMSTRTSTWGRVLSVWAKDTGKQHDGRLAVKVVHNGGDFAVDEADIVARLQSGRWDGAALSEVGLSMLVPSVAGILLAGQGDDLRAAEAMLAVGKQSFEDGLKAKGFTALAWGVRGRRRLFSRGVAVRGPSDLAGQALWVPTGDAATAGLAELTGARAMSAPLAGLRAGFKKGTLGLVITTASEVIERDLAGELDTVVATPLGWSIGAVVVRTDALDALASDLRESLGDSAALAGHALDARPDAVDAANYAELAKTLSASELSAEHLSQWSMTEAQVADKLAKSGAVPAELMSALRSG